MLDDRTAGLLVESDVLGVRRGFQAKLVGLSDMAFLAAIAALPPDELALLADAIGARLSGMPAGDVARWWDSLGDHSAAQQALIVGLPATLGNLDGVSYWARDQANRMSVQRALVDARRRVRSAESSGDIGKLADSEQYLARLSNFAAGARTSVNVGGDTVRQMVSFRPGPPPLGAFSLGDLDTAAGVSYLVPGMTTTLGDTTVVMRAASNVMAAQRVERPDANTALVAWIGYEAPPSPQESPGVFGLAHARKGADNLAIDLRGLRSRRGDVQIDVIGHSYGSTTAALTLAHAPELRVHSFLTLGSAGMPGEVPDAAATNVEKMYAAQAEERVPYALIGRFLSVYHTQDPDNDFGAESIDVSGTDGMNGVNVHGLLVNGPQHPDDVGYLDQGTNSVRAAAMATLP